MQKEEKKRFNISEDGFYGELLIPKKDKYPEKVLMFLGGSSGDYEFIKDVAKVFCSQGLTVFPMAYVNDKGLKSDFSLIPIDMIELAAKMLHKKGYKKVGLWGISKGAELVLTAASLLPELINAVVAVAPINTVCQAFTKKKGFRYLPGSSWSYKGEPLPYTPYKNKKFPKTRIIINSIKKRDLTLYDIYLPVVENPDENAVIKVEKINGPILLISSKMDNLFTSEIASKKIIDRLKEYSFPYPYEHLSYDYGSHIFIPLDFSFIHLLKGDRGKNKKRGLEARMDSLYKTLEFVSTW